MPTDAPRMSRARVVLVTGPSGAGRSTAIAALEDLDYEVIDNLPLSLVDRLLHAPDDASSPSRALALGIDVRNRDFSTDALIGLIDRLEVDPAITMDLLYLDASSDILQRRYSETRRRHPLAPLDTPGQGIAQEIALLAPIRDRAATLIDTSDLTPHDLRAELGRLFGEDGSPGLALSIQSFSYKRGMPRGTDMAFDMRFLRNPHWEPSLRALDGRDGRVAAFVEADPRFVDVFDRIAGLTLALLPAYRDEGKSHLSIAIGCTGGQHRSVSVAEKLARALADAGWRVSIRHRELERLGLLQGARQHGDGQG